MKNSAPASALSGDGFVRRHIGPSEHDMASMLDTLGYDSLDAFIDATIPKGIRFRKPLGIPAGLTEHEALIALRAMASKNQIFRSYIGMGYSDCITPPVVQRNILE